MGNDNGNRTGGSQEKSNKSTYLFGFSEITKISPLEEECKEVVIKASEVFQVT